MNQHQRKFLLEEIEKQFRAERDSLKTRKPSEPNLNNYLVAAILDGSAKMRPQDELRECIRKRTRDLGKDEALVKSSGRWAREDEADMIHLPALMLFEAPPAFAEVHAQYLKDQARWEAQWQALDASFNAMRIKVQVGSDEALESLVAQADNLCSMSLTAAHRLMLPAA